MNEITIPYEEYRSLNRLKARVEVLTELISKYGEFVTIKEVIAVLDLEVKIDD
jgi:hypothetical protein